MVTAKLKAVFDDIDPGRFCLAGYSVEHPLCPGQGGPVDDDDDAGGAGDVAVEVVG